MCRYTNYSTHRLGLYFHPNDTVVLIVTMMKVDIIML